MSSDVNETNKRKRDNPEEKPGIKNDLLIQKDEKPVSPSKRQKGDSDSSDSDCISQEDLLAQLGLNSVKKLKADEPSSKKVVHPEPPKQSILEFLSCPVVSKKVESSPNPCKEKPLTNGYVEDGEDEDGGDGDQIDKKEKLIVHLQNNLRNEEAKLLLLRKLYACQNDKLPGKDTNPAQTRATPVTTATTTQAQPSAAASQRKTVPVAATHKQQTLQTAKVQSPSVPPRVVFLTQPRGQPVIIAPKLLPVSSGKSAAVSLQEAAGRSVRNQHVSLAQNAKATASVSNSTTKVIQRPQPVHPTAVYAQSAIGNTANKAGALRGATTIHGGSDKMRPSENGLIKPGTTLNIIHSPSPPQQSQAEAKLALRKQLERTLLQIPLPKPPVQDWGFVPSVNTQDFTILIGLEGVVNHILESKDLTSNQESKTGPTLTPPRFCTQCDTDFTPAWRKKSTEDDSKLVTLCEMCFTQKIKKTLKAEHTSRLKAAFVKAVKQEQEVDQKFQASGGAAANKSKSDTSSKSVSRPSSHHQLPSLQGARVVYHPSVHHSLQPQVFQPHHSIVQQLQQQQLQQQHQELEGGHPQETRYFTYVGQHNCQPQHKQRHNYPGDHDRQREYLLDMIPSGHTSRGYRI